MNRKHMHKCTFGQMHYRHNIVIMPLKSHHYLLWCMCGKQTRLYMIFTFIFWSIFKHFTKRCIVVALAYTLNACHFVYRWTSQHVPHSEKALLFKKLCFSPSSHSPHILGVPITVCSPESDSEWTALHRCVICWFQSSCTSQLLLFHWPQLSDQ